MLAVLPGLPPQSLYVPPPLGGISTISFTPIPLREDAPQRRRLGRLLFLEGWSLHSPHPRFGGISALHVQRGAALGLADTGTLIAFPLPRRPGRARVSLWPLPDGPGSPLDKRKRDSESLLIAGGRAWVGFEYTNQVWRYGLPSWRGQAHAAPPDMRRWPYGTGAEAMVRLPDGRFLVFAENSGRQDGTTDVLLFAGDPAVPGTPALDLRYRPPQGYHPTDAALLPDGRLLILNRRFTFVGGFVAKLVEARLPPLQAGAAIAGTEIADFSPPAVNENFEGLSATREAGRTILWIVSDDNLSPLQRTLLLKFVLLD